MKLRHALLPAAALVALSLAAMPADAQQRRGGGNRGGGGQTAPRASAPPQRAAPRQSQPRAGVQQQRAYSQAPRSGVQQQRSYAQQAVPRQGPVPRAYANRPPSYGHGSAYGYTGVPGRRAYVAPRRGYGVMHGYGYGYRPYYYPRPYYAFRPRVSLGFGLWIGFPTAYPYYSYGYANPTYGYPLSRFGFAAGVAYGGISFEVDPYDSAVFVDGEYAGVVGNFGPDAQPLTLRAGTHRVEIQAAGCDPVMFDVNVMPGQVIPYRGSMRPY